MLRIRGPIRLCPPVLSRFECQVEVWQRDANAAAREIRGLDLAYVNPPYNQHPYGSNYFMLNLLVRYQRPEDLSRVSGIPAGWRRSGYNSKPAALDLLRDLLGTLDATFLLVSFNNEGFVELGTMLSMLAAPRFRRCLGDPVQRVPRQPNLRNRDVHVTERLFLVEPK